MSEQLPDGLQLAVNLLEGDRDAFVVCHRHPIHGLEQADAEIAGEYLGAINAIRDENDQRVTMQHHAADLAQQIEDLRFAAEAGGRRIADLEAERDHTAAHVASIARQLGDESLPVDDIAVRVLGLVAERDALRARLAASEASDAESIRMYRATRSERDALRAKLDGIEAQEPSAIVCTHVSGGAVVRRMVGSAPLEPETVLYARPVHVQAVPESVEGLVSVFCYDEVLTFTFRDEAAADKFAGRFDPSVDSAAAPEHKA